jgi:hypothetical protein
LASGRVEISQFGVRITGHSVQWNKGIPQYEAYAWGFRDGVKRMYEDHLAKENSK